MADERPWLHFVDLAREMSPRSAGDQGVPEAAMADSVHLNDLGCHQLAAVVSEAIGKFATRDAAPPLPMAGDSACNL